MKQKIKKKLFTEALRNQQNNPMIFSAKNTRVNDEIDLIVKVKMIT